ncbi:MAG: uroporphyrinogen decarboxylase family protein [Clostridia bacterium]
MIPKERMNKVFCGQFPDRAPFVPSIYEHGAAVIGSTPSIASCDATLMAAAAVESYKAYGHDLVTVGIDIYNIEAEAFGCPVRRFDNHDIPAVYDHPLAAQEKLDSSDLAIPEEGDNGNRLGLIVEACRKAYAELKDEVPVYACMGGPFSQAVELRGFDNFLMDMIDDPAAAHALMQKTTELSVRHARRLSEQKVGINVYESWATLPLISPDIFRDFVVPYEKHIVAEIRSAYDTPAPAVILGGNTSMLMDFFLDIDTSLVVADYMTDFAFMRRKLREGGSRMVVRGCLDPKRIERGEWQQLQAPIATLAEASKDMPNFVWGCGCVSIDTTKENLLHFKDLCLEAAASCRKS